MKKILLKLFKEERVLNEFHGIEKGSYKAPESRGGAKPGVIEDAKEPNYKRKLDRKKEFDEAEGAIGSYYDEWAGAVIAKGKSVMEKADKILEMDASEHTKAFRNRVENDIKPEIKKIVENQNLIDDADDDFGSQDVPDETLRIFDSDLASYEAELEGESGSASIESTKNQGHKENFNNMTKEMVDDAAAIERDIIYIGGKQPKELGTAYAEAFTDYNKNTVLPIAADAVKYIEKANDKALSNVTVEFYLKKAREVIDNASNLAEIYVYNIGDYDEAIRDTLENKDYTDPKKFVSHVLKRFQGAAVTEFNEGKECTQEGSMKGKGEALVKTYEPVFTMAKEAEEFTTDEMFNGANGIVVKGKFRAEMDTLLQKTDKKPEDLVKEGKNLVETYTEKGELAKTLDDINDNSEYGGEKGTVVKNAAKKELDKFLGDKKINNPEQAAKEKDRLTASWNARLEVAKNADEMLKEPKYKEAENKLCAAVLGKVKTELDPILENNKDAENKIKTEGDKSVEGFKVRFEMALKIDEMANDPMYTGPRGSVEMAKITQEAQPLLEKPCENPGRLKDQIEGEGGIIKKYKPGLQRAALMDGTRAQEDEIKKALALEGSPHADAKSKEIIKKIYDNPKLKEIADEYKKETQVTLADKADVFDQFSGGNYKGWKQVNQAFAQSLGIEGSAYNEKDFRERVKDMQRQLGTDAEGSPLAVDGAIGPKTMGAISAYKSGQHPKSGTPIQLPNSEVMVAEAEAASAAKAEGKKGGKKGGKRTVAKGEKAAVKAAETHSGDQA